MNFLIFDIGSGSVGAAGIIVRRENNRTFLSFTARESIAPALNLEPSHFFSSTLSVLRKLSEHIFSLHREEVLSAEKIHIFLHSPWIVSKTRAVKASFQEPTFLSADTLAAAIQNAERGIEESFKMKHIDISSAVRAVEKKIIEFKVNGYPVESALDKEASTLEFALLESFSPENAVSKFSEIIGNFSHAPREFHGAAAALATASAAISKNFSSDSAFISTDSEATEIAFSKEGIVRDVISVSCGFRTLARIACENKTFHSVAAVESFFRTPTVRTVKFIKERECAASEWGRVISEIIAKKQNSGFFVKNISVCCNEKYKNFFAEACNEISIPVQFEDFELTVERSRSSPADSFLMGESCFISLF